MFNSQSPPLNGAEQNGMRKLQSSTWERIQPLGGNQDTETNQTMHNTLQTIGPARYNIRKEERDVSGAKRTCIARVPCKQKHETNAKTTPPPRVEKRKRKPFWGKARNSRINTCKKRKENPPIQPILEATAPADSQLKLKQ